MIGILKKFADSVKYIENGIVYRKSRNSNVVAPSPVVTFNIIAKNSANSKNSIFAMEQYESFKLLVNLM